MAHLRNLLLFCIVSLYSAVAFPCGNEYYSTPEIPFAKGKLVLNDLLKFPHDNTYPYWHHGFGENIAGRYYELSWKIDKAARDSGNLEWATLENALKRKVDYKLLSDFTWYELRVGDKELAVKLLEKLYSEHPNEYNILANLGTAYEVTGNNDKALVLLRKAVALNPASHYGSEWIHIHILEQKVKAQPDYTAILALDAGKDYEAWLKGTVYNKPLAADSLMTQLAYQLHERISFVPKPDPIVGQLVFDFADLTALIHGQAKAIPFYNYALGYDSSLAVPFKERINGRSSKKEDASLTSDKSSRQWLYIGAGTVAVLLLLFVVLRKRKVS